jgi:hypothetical protein
MLAIDRRRWLAVLHWVLWVNSWHDRLYFRLIHGDKVGVSGWQGGCRGQGAHELHSAGKSRGLPGCQVRQLVASCLMLLDCRTRLRSRLRWPARRTRTDRRVSGNQG